MARSDQTISFYNSSHTRKGCRLLMLGGWTAAGQQDRSVVPLAPKDYPLLFAFYSQEKLRWIVLIVVRFQIVP